MRRWILALALVACGDGAGSDDDGPGPDGAVDFVGMDGFYLVNYDGWSKDTCNVYVQDRLGAQVNVQFDGDRLVIEFDKRDHTCDGDVATQSFTCEDGVRGVGFGQQHLDASVGIWHSFEGVFTDEKHFHGTERVHIECDGQDCMEAKDLVPPFPWASEDLTFPCDTTSTYQAEWVE